MKNNRSALHSVIYKCTLPLKRLDLRLLSCAFNVCLLLLPPSWHRANLNPPICIYFAQQWQKMTSTLLPVQLDLSQSAWHSALRKSVLPWKAMWRPIGQPLAFPSREGRSLSVAGNHWLEQGNSFGFSGPDRLAHWKIWGLLFPFRFLELYVLWGKKDCGQHGPRLRKYHAVCKSPTVNGCRGCHNLF